MKVYVITLQMDYEGEMVQEVWAKKPQAQHRIDYLNKNIAGSLETYDMREFTVKEKLVKLKDKDALGGLSENE